MRRDQVEEYLHAASTMSNYTDLSRLIRPSFNSTFGDLRFWSQLRLIRHSTFVVFTFFEIELRLIRHRY